MSDLYVKSGSGVVDYSNKVWTLGEKMVPTRADATANVAVARGWVWEVTTAGTSTATPVWPASAAQDVTTVNDSGVVWTARKPGFSSGSTADWTFATTYLDYAVNVAAAGDRVFVSDEHNEISASAITMTSLGTLISPIQILAVDDSAAPPTALVDTAIVSTTLANTITLNGYAFVDGVQFKSGSGANAGSIRLNNATASATQRFENCTLQLESTSGSSVIALGNTSSSNFMELTLKDCDVKLGNNGQGISFNYAHLNWEGGAVIAGSTTPTGIFNANGKGTDAVISGVDLSAFADTVNLVRSNNTNGRVMFRNCKLPAAWSGSVVTTSPTAKGFRAEMHNCDSADTNYRLWVEDYAGSIKNETTVVRSAGGSDGTVPFSLKMETNANAAYPLAALDSIPLPAIWNDTIAEEITVSVEILHDSLTALNNDEIWIELQYLGTSGSPLSSFVTNAKASVLASAAAQTASNTPWTTTGLTDPHKQKLVVSFTPQEVGYLQAVVCLAKASTTVYIDPVLQVS